MNKGEINLLPVKIQTRRSYRALIFGVGRFLRYLYLSLLMLSAVLILIFVAMLSIQNIVLDEDSVGGDLADINSQAREINQLLQEFELKVDGYVAWSDLLEEVIGAAPGGMNITSISVTEGELEMKIGGVANGRDPVQNFQTQLESLQWVGGLEAPLQNFATGERARFSFVVRIDEDQL